MSNDADRARRAFGKFLALHSISARALSKAAGLSPSAATQYMKGNSDSPRADTFKRFAKGASDLLERPVTVGEMTGDASVVIDVAVRSYVGAGDEVFPIEEDGPIDYTPAPPGMEDAEATLVRGASMRPLYSDGDLLFHRRLETDPGLFKDEVVVAQVKGGKRYVKLILPGTQRGRFHLVSFNQANPPIEDQTLLWVAPIVWVHKRQHR